jgi:hypothetical protein
MAQKTNPLAFRNLNNFENSFCHQQVYKKKLSPYVLKEHKKIKSFVESFFKNTNLVPVGCFQQTTKILVLFI